MNFLRPERRRVAYVTAAAAIAIAGAAITAGLNAAPATERLTGQQAQVRELEAQLISLDGEAGAIADAHSQAATRLQEARGAVAKNTRDLKLARKNRAKAIENLERRLVAIYQTKKPSIAEVVLGSSDINDTLDQLDLLRRAGEQDRDVLASVKGTRQQLANSRGALLRLRGEAADQERDAREKRQAMERLLAERREVLETARGALASAEAAQADRIAAAQAQGEEQIRERAEPVSNSAPEGSTSTSNTPDPPPSSSSSVSEHLARIAQCESGGNPRAISPSGLYRGKYQFSTDTWIAVGGSGDPAAASEAEQDRRAAILYSQRGAQPWPICGS